MNTKMHAILMLALLGCQTTKGVADQALLGECDQELEAQINTAFDAEPFTIPVSLEPDENGEVVGWHELQIADGVSVLIQIAPDPAVVEQLVAQGETELPVTFDPRGFQTFWTRTLDLELVERGRDELGATLIDSGVAFCGGQQIVLEAVVATQLGEVPAAVAIGRPLPGVLGLPEDVASAITPRPKMCPIFKACTGTCTTKIKLKGPFGTEIETGVVGTCKEVAIWSKWFEIKRCACLF